MRGEERESQGEGEREWLRDKREEEDVVWAWPVSWPKSMAAIPLWVWLQGVDERGY